MSQIPTVKVKSNLYSDGYFVINESDFDPEKHERWTEKDAKAVAKAKANEPPQVTEKPGFKLEDHARGKTAEALVAAGLGTALAIHQAELEDLVAVPGVGQRIAEQLKAAAATYVEEPLES